MRTVTNTRLNIESPLVNESAANFRLSSWPPPLDFPVVIDQDGTVMSRYGDSSWDLTAWARRPHVLNFGDGVLRNGAQRLSGTNADILRMVDAWWLWAINPPITAGTMVAQHQLVKTLLALCTSEGIDGREISRYPAVIERFANAVPESRSTFILTLLHSLYERRDELGFTLLDVEALRRLASCLPHPPDKKQTAYIPPRIWTYQVSRLRAVLDDFDHHSDKIEACYRAAVNAYATAYGSLLAARNTASRVEACGSNGGFDRLAKEFEIDQLLLRWYATKKERQPQKLPIRALTNFLTLVNRAGLAYLLNFSLMRIEEAWCLRTDCLHIEHDEKLGEIAILCGETTKTVHDDDARWITSPSVKVAVDALSRIARWRLKVREAYGELRPEGTPCLIQGACEPWVNRNEKKGRKGKTSYPCFAELVSDHPKLFEPSEILVTQEDWNLAKVVTPTLDDESFGVGRTWPFRWHQLRRTGAVNMQASGLVSSFSLQFQLKHSMLATSFYYGQGYARLAFNRNAKAEYVRTMYEFMGKDVADLFSDRFVSPYGKERKQAILQIVSESDSKKLVAAAKAGRVAWRRTLLGGCTKRGPCEYGGVDNIVRCGGGDHKEPCADALFDRDRLPIIKRLSKMISDRIETAENGSPYQLSLEAQRRSVENALNVLENQ